MEPVSCGASVEVDSGGGQPLNPEPVPVLPPADPHDLAGPFTARGVKVMDVHKKTIAMCTGNPWAAQVIADALNGK